MQTALRRSFKYLAGQNRSRADARSFRHKYDNVQFRCEGRYKLSIRVQLVEKRKCCLSSAFQPACEFATLFQWRRFVRGRQSRRSRPWTGALQAYLTQVQLLGAEIGVGRIVLIPSSDLGVAKDHATAPIGLQSMLVRVDHNGVRFSDPRKCSPCFFLKVLCQHKISAVGRIGMNSESMFCTEGQNLRQWIH